jgi:hypothetical protein
MKKNVSKKLKNPILLLYHTFFTNYERNNLPGKSSIIIIYIEYYIMQAEGQPEGFLFKPEAPASSFDSKTIIIVALVLILVISFLGINLLTITGNAFQQISDTIGPPIVNLLSAFGYTTGTVINKTADVVGDTAKTGVDIAQGTVYDVGNLIKDASTGVDSRAKVTLDNAINSSSRISPVDLSRPPKEPEAAPAENPIQKPISSGKSSWCLVGEYKEKRGCVEIDEHDKCLSGQVFPSQKMCLNPTMTP